MNGGGSWKVGIYGPYIFQNTYPVSYTHLRLIKEQEEEARKADVMLFLENFLEGIKNGRIKNGAENYTPNTCKVWSLSLIHISNFGASAWVNSCKRLYCRKS